MPQRKMIRTLSLAAIACSWACSWLFTATPAAAIDAAVQAQQMGGGLNVLGYDPIWSDPAKAVFKERYFAIIKQAGFKTLRVNLQAFPHMNAANELDPQWLKTLDWVVSEATGQGLIVILDEHDYESCGQDAIQCRVKLTAFWQQIGHHFRDAPDSVLFELLNEPNGQLTPVLWNAYLARLLNVVRGENATRNVIIGPAFSNSFRHLQELSLPAKDRHIIVTIHYYEPLTFTHQGAPWVPGGAPPVGATWGSESDRQTLAANFETVKEWSIANRRPIFLGEFGAYEKGDMKSRVAYISAVARAAEARNWPWAYWQFDGNFIAYDTKTDHWIQPILDALHPPLE